MHTPDVFDQTGTMDTTETGGMLNNVAPVFVEAQKRAEQQVPEPVVPLTPAVTPQVFGEVPPVDVGGPAAEQPLQPTSVDYDQYVVPPVQTFHEVTTSPAE